MQIRIDASNAITHAKNALRPLGQVRFEIERLKYGKSLILPAHQGNEYLRKSLSELTPTSIAKIGATELGALRRFVRFRDSEGECRNWAYHSRKLFINAGVYPESATVHSQFARTFMYDLRYITSLCVWFRWGENKIVREHANAHHLLELASLEPYYHRSPWSSALLNKNVLVVSPFATAIVSQYKHRRKIWPGRDDILPDFNLSTISCPLSAAIVPPVDKTWGDTLNRIKSEMRETRYDAAIIGAGAWSLPLVAEAFRNGKWAIHLGGPTQILFGIKGGRWDNNDKIKAFFNSAWIRPPDDLKPAAYSTIEQGCYW